ncbi:hypothetical protein SUGI_0026400 [Cryptomeria japonica]|nr:hypothetical protein SUGI_0026400 [Cryptomeria japonica]
MACTGGIPSIIPPVNAAFRVEAFLNASQTPVPPSSVNTSTRFNGDPSSSAHKSLKAKSFSEAITNSAGSINEQARKEGHRRKDCPILAKASAKSANNMNAQPNPPLSVNPTIASTSEGRHVKETPNLSGSSQNTSARNLNLLPLLEANSGPELKDGFTLVRNRKKRKGNSSGNPKTKNLNSTPSSPPTSNIPPIVDMINFPGHSFDSVNPVVNLSKPSPKIFKEIEDDYVFEIIPASGSSQFGFKMDMELNDINEAPRWRIHLRRRARVRVTASTRQIRKIRNGRPKSSGSSPCDFPFDVIFIGLKHLHSL